MVEIKTQPGNTIVDQMQSGHLIVIEDPGGPKTPEEQHRARLWFSDVVANMAERRRDVIAIPCHNAEPHDT